MNLTPEELDWLRSQPDFLEIHFMGRVRPWVLSDEALRQAEAEGIPLGTVLGVSLASDDGDDAGAFRGVLDTVTARLFAGFRVFDPEMTVERVRVGVTARNAREYLRMTNEALYSADAEAEGDAEAEVETAETEGNPQRGNAPEPAEPPAP